MPCFSTFGCWLSCRRNKDTYKFIIAAFIAGLLLLTRVFRVKDNEMCDGHHEPLCGKRTCAFSGERRVSTGQPTFSFGSSPSWFFSN